MRIESPNRATRTYTQHLIAPPPRVFELLCPVREVDWAQGWEPSLVVSRSGLAEPDCVFVTPGEPNAVWYITRHEPEQGFVEMLKITPDVTACRLTIRVEPHASGSAATITYSHTSLGPRGDALVAAFTDAHYARFMQEWETEMNHFLAHGTPLVAREQP